MSLDVLDKIDRAKTKMRESLGHLTPPETLEHTLKRKLDNNKTNS